MKNLFFFNQRSNAAAQATECAYTTGQKFGVNPTKTSTFGRFATYIGLVLVMLVTLGVGEMWAGTYTVVGVAMTNTNNYYPRYSVNIRGNNYTDVWQSNCFADHKAGITFEGKKLYLANWTDNFNGIQDLYFQQYSTNCENEQNYNTVYSTNWTGVSSYNTKIWNYNESGTSGSWYSALTMTQSKVYFDATGWSETDIDLCIAHMNYQAYYGMSSVEHTKLYYTNESYSWNDAMGFGVVGGYSRTDGQDATGNYWITDISDNAAEYTGFKHTALNNNGANYAYLVVNAGKAGQEPTVSSNSSYTTLLNSTQTIESYVSTDYGSSYSNANSKATITISSYAMTSQGASGATASNGSLSTSAKSTTVTAARTATTTLSVGDVADGYVFEGWYNSSNSLLSTETSYTYYPSGATTIRARFKNETSHTVTISNYCTTTSSEISSSNRGIGETTAVSVTAPEITGYTFVNWTLGTGISNQSGSTTANPISVKTLSTGTYTMQANYTAKTTVRLYYTNPGGFSTPKAYFWYSSTTSDNNGWPGTAMTSTTECGDTYYYVEYYKEDHPNWNRVIFNDNGNSSTQTSNITFSNTTNNGQYNNAPASKSGTGSWSSTAPQKWALSGSMNSWSTSANMFTCDDGTLSLDISLSANTDYNFKIVNVPADKWYGTASATKITYVNQATAQTISQENGAENAYQTMRSAAAGTYTFTWDPSDKKVKVSYPTSYKVELEVGTVKGNANTPIIYHTSVDNANKVTSGNYVAAGTKVIFWVANSAAAAPKAGYNWWGFYNNDAGIGSGLPDKYTDASVSVYTINSIATNAHVYAVFGEIDYYITPYINGQGSVSPNGANAHIATPTSFTATPGTGYMFSSWEERGGSAMTIATPSAATTNVTTTAAATLQVNFVPRWSVVGTDAFGGWSAYGTNLFTGYTKVSTKDVGYKTITLAANTNYEIKVYDRANSTLYGGSANQTIDYAHSGAGNEYTIATTSSPKSVFIQSAAGGTYTLNWNLTDKKIAVVYPTSWYITTGVNDALGGSFTAVDNSSNNVYGGKFVANSANVVFTATPNTGYDFSGWYSDNTCTTPYTAGTGVAFSGEGNTVMTLSGITANKTVYAKFTAKTYTVTLTRSGTGYGSGGSGSVTATYNQTLPAATLPTAANGYAFMGYYTAADGKGTQFMDASGNWVTSVTDTISDSKWVLDAGATLYAYFKKAEITSITFDPGTVVENNSSVSVTATISPTPTGTTTICWRVLHNDTGNPLDPQPTFTPSAQGTSVSFTSPNESGMYRVEAVLHTGSGCAGTDLDTREATFQVAGSHTVTVAYKYSGTTIKASTSVTGRPLAWSDEITAPDIFGYSFSSWSAGDGITITDDDGASSKTSSSSATIKIKATYNGTLTANYTPKKLIYFKNTLGWSNVYVNFYKSDYWNSDKGSGNNGVPVQNKAMTRYGETDIWYYDYGSDNFTGYTNTKPTNYVSFTSATQSSAENFWASGTGISVSYPARRSDDLADKSGETGFYESSPMFVPLAGQSAITKNNSGGGKALYYNSGYWTKYLPGTGYTLEIYNADGNSKIKEMDFSSADELMPMKAVVDLEANTTYKFQIKRHGDVYLGNSGSMSYANHGQATPWEMTSTGFSMCGIATTAAGNYTFNFTYSANASNQYRLRISVDYPVANGDYRLIYTDNTRNSGTRYKPSAIVNKENNGTAIVSFFVRHNNSPVLRIQQATVDNSGNITWNEYPTSGTPTNQITGSIASAITKDTVYNFNLSMNGSGALSVSSVEYYSGNYYIRTDAANSKWDNYRTDPDHLMTYSEYSITHGGYSHYYTHWVNKDEAGRKNVKFCIANDYSPCISDTLARETASGAWAHIADWMEEGGDLKRSANVRFMWDIATNTISRAYVDGAQEDGSEFLLMLNTDSPNKIKWADETALTSNKVTFSDNGNWIYETNIKAQPNAKIKLKSTWGNTGNAIVQYFKGTSSEDETLIGGSGTDWYDFRLIYDFKTNRLVASYVPTTGTISSDVSINADVMFIREHQGDIAQLTFSGSGKISKINTAYGVMRFSKWTLNNKAKAEPHSPLGTELSRFERDIFYISFPFRVNLEEVFGFGTYGTHWIIEEYDGAERASKGFWAETETFWKFITNRRGKFLEPNTGYILALDLDELGESSSVWANTDVVELYFPSYGTMPNITASSVTHELPEHACTIGPRFSGGDDRRMKDSHWNVMSVPTYINTDDVTFANTDWITTKTATTVGPQFLYTWNMNNNTLTATSGTSYTYKAMHAYMVQYCGNVTWTTSVSPALAPRRSEDAPTDVEFRLELQQDEQKADQAFIKLSYDEHVTTGFDFNYDLSKEMNGGQANVYTMITSVIDNEASLTEAAGNVLPMSEQTTVVPVGVKIAADGDYTFAIPDGTEGVGVTLIDQETGIRTSLSALAYTVTLEAGTYDERFVLEISPIHNVPTEQSAVRDQQSDVRKVLIDGLLYIVRDNKMYDARGAMIMEK